MTTILSITVPPGSPNDYRVPVGAYDQGYAIYINEALLDEQVRAALPEVVDVGHGFVDVGDPAVRYWVAMITFPSPPDQSQRDAVDAVIAAHDPTGLTAEQQEAADLAAELELVVAKIAIAKANRDAITGDEVTPGLKDAVNGNTDLAVVGFKTPLANANWNTLTDAQRIGLLRDMWRGAGFTGLNDILIALLNAMLDGTRADLTELREIRDRLRLE